MPSKKPKRVSVRDMFLRHQEQMVAELTRLRSIVEHPGAKGDGSEECWRQLLRTYLPKRYSVEGAFILDCDGNLSDQIDLVIFDQQYSPFLFHQGGVFYVPAESVYAVFEVKQEMTADYITYAGAKARSVRKLRRTSAKIPYAAGSYPAKPLHHIPAGILTLECSWSNGLGKTFQRHIKGLPATDRLDLGCVIGSGAFQCTYEGGKTSINVSAPDDALITFFLRLTAELQKIGTVPAIDFECWQSPLSLDWTPVKWEAATVSPT